MPTLWPAKQPEFQEVAPIWIVSLHCEAAYQRPDLRGNVIGQGL